MAAEPEPKLARLMDWATAAALVSDRTPDLSDAPDPPGDDAAFWEEVQRLVDGDGLQEASVYEEGLHPRDRTGKWMAKLGLSRLREVGGAPRDDLLGKVPKDIDYMAMESPERIKAAVEAVPGAHAEDLTVRDRLVGVRATHPDLPPGGVEIVPPRVEQSTGEGRKDFAIVPHPGLQVDAEKKTRLEREITRVERNLRAAQERANNSAGVYNESYAQADARDRRSQATIRKHKQTLARLERQHDALMAGATPEKMTADDAQRRDFTVNSLYRDPETGELTDPTGHGEQDARNRVLRMVHDQSFQEDPLRMLRGARFAAQHALEPEPATLAAMKRDSGGMTALTQKGVSGTVQEELRKLLMSDNPGVGLRLMRDTGMFQTLLPELAPMVGFDQRSMYHEHVLDEHTFEVIDELARQGASYEARLAALFHDSGKPLTANPKPDGTFRFHSHPVYGHHADVGADIARTTLNRLNYPRDTINHVSDLVREHMVTAVEKPTPVKARRLRARFSDKFLNDLLDHKAADGEGHGEHIAVNRMGIQKLRDLLAENADSPRSVKDLLVNGRDLMAEGIEAGPTLGKVLRQLLSEVIDNPELNRREWLLGRAQKLAALKTQEWPETDEELPELEEATIYEEALHPRDRLGRWLLKEFGEQHAKPSDKKGRAPTPYRAARWADTGQDFGTMAHEAARLTHPEGSAEEHAAIAQAVVADTPPPKTVSAEAKAATKTLRAKSTPEGLWGKYIYRLHGIATEAHAGQTDHSGKPYIQHVEAVADSVSDEAKPVALFHDALEDTELKPEALKQALTEPKVTTPEQAQTIVDAIGHLSRDDKTEYEQYVKNLKNAPGKAGELAREVKRADLQHNLGRMTSEIEAKKPNLKPRYEKALKTLAPERQPITQRGAPLNVNNLDAKVVMGRLRKLYESSEAAGTAEIERDWYQTAHDQIQARANEHDVDPHTLAAMVAATSPQLTWRHEYKDGRVRYPNLDLAVNAIRLARAYPHEPAPKLVDRLIEESRKRPKGTPSELGGLGESILKAVRIYRGEDPERVLGAPKTRSFANNLTYPDQETTVTMDEHMARAMLGKGKENYSKSTEGVFNEKADGSGYTWSADLVKRLAKEKGVLPHQAQAIVWVAQKQIADEMEAAAKAAKASA